MKISTLVLFSGFCLVFPCLQLSFASENLLHYDNILSQANEAYTRGNYDSAITLYGYIENAGYESSTLYFNLGNSYYKNKNIPMAVLYYERAKKIEPEDNDILFNLQLANQQIADKIEPLPELFFTKWRNALISSASVDSWANWTIVFIIYAMLMFLFFILAESAFLKRTYFWSGIAGIILTISCFYFAFSQHQNSINENQAIVFSPSVTTKSSPDDNSTNLFVIHEGTKVIILEKVNEWCKISLPDGNIGWMRMEEVRVI